MPRLIAFLVPALAALLAGPAAAQSYLAKPQSIGGNPGPAHNYVCPNIEAGATALDCFLDAARHLYTMCKHVKSIEIIEHGYELSEAGTNSAKSEYCIDKQKQNIARPYQAALREASISKQAVDGLRSLHEYWIASLVALKWRSGESDDDYKERTGGVLQDLQARAEGIRAIVAVVREHTSSKPKTVAREKAPR
ncbi:MAG TPA: hypothetical protein VFX05_11225 [Casimicrobiaceae bacterium]|nr:hypothetical protein [Casimicrobiaceae bacterium]